MKILIRKTSNLVVCITNKCYILTDKVITDTFVSYDLNSSNAYYEELDSDRIPTVFSLDMYSYNDGTFTLVDNEEYAEKLNTIFKPIKKAEIKEAFILNSQNVIVDTGLGFSVNGTYSNKVDFETGKKHNIPAVRAADNLFYDVTQADYDVIINAIEVSGMALFQKKWELEKLIDAATTYEELSLVRW